VSVHGSDRIATENTMFAMPETGIGLFPDVGGSYFLSRCPGALGMYLGLTGARLGAADAIYCGIAQHFVPSAKWDALSDADSIAAVAQSAGPVKLAPRRALIDRCFGKGSVEEILAALASEQDPFAAETLAPLKTKSPTSLKITHRQIRAGRDLPFDDCMRMEWRMVSRVIAGHDFYEGTRAAIIDKDRNPRWQPARIEDVGAAEVARYFAPLAGDELRFDWET
jgi:enoyl-CoA hydratase